MRRGQVSLLVMVVVTAVMAMTVVFFTRLSIEQGTRQRDEGRLCALWLARSAVLAGVGAGASTVETGHGAAKVQVFRAGGTARAVVEIPAVGRAEVTSAAGAWEERFERAP